MGGLRIYVAQRALTHAPRQLERLETHCVRPGEVATIGRGPLPASRADSGKASQMRIDQRTV